MGKGKYAILWEEAFALFSSKRGVLALKWGGRATVGSEGLGKSGNSRFLHASTQMFSFHV